MNKENPSSDFPGTLNRHLQVVKNIKQSAFHKNLLIQHTKTGEQNKLYK